MTQVQVPNQLLPSYQTLTAFPPTLQATVRIKCFIYCCPLSQSTVSGTYRACKYHWMNGPENRQYPDSKTRPFPTIPCRLIMLLYKIPLFYNFSLKIPVTGSLERLYASCCLDNSTSLGLIWYWLKGKEKKNP